MRNVIIVFFLLVPILSSFAQINHYQKEWLRIDSLEHFRRMDSAIVATQSLMDKTLRDNANPSAKAHYIKAFIYKSKYEAEKEFKTYKTDAYSVCYLKELDYVSKKLIALAEKTTDEVLKSMLHYTIADMLLQYRRNYMTCNKIARNAVYDYSYDDDVAKLVPNPFLDSINQVLNKIELEIASHLLLSTASEATHKIPAHHFSILLENSTFIDTTQFRFSLYDLLIDNAIWYLNQHPEDISYTNPTEIYPLTDSMAFASVEHFVNFDFTVKEEYPLRIEGYKLYQKLLRIHLNDSNKNILAKFDFERMLFARRYSNQRIQDIQNYFLNALLTLEKKYAAAPFSTTIAYEIGDNIIENQYSSLFYPYSSRWNLKLAYELCTAAVARHPKSIGAKNCQIIINKVLQKELRFEIESVSPIDKPILAKVSSKNIDKIHCKILQLPPDFLKIRDEIHYYSYNLNRDSSWAAYLSKLDIKKATSWSVTIPNSGDFKTHSIEIAVPKQKAGAYLLLFSEKETFSLIANGVVSAYFQVSDLAYIVRSRNLNKQFDEFFVVNRNNGAPIAGVNITFWDLKNKKTGTAISAEDGYFSTEKISNPDYYYTIQLENSGDFLHLADLFALKNYGRDYEGNRTFFFLDKSIYRPGQTLHYKGILSEFKYNGLNNILPHQQNKITFYDVNRQEVAHQYITTNEYGSFSGTFTIPTSGLLGRMFIQDSLTNSTSYFNVEEYKKPTFELYAFSKWLNGKGKDKTLEINGKAETFSKMPLAGALVQYTIVREQYRDYNHYDYFNDYQDLRMDTLVVETTTINEKGQFSIQLEVPVEKDTTIRGYDYKTYIDIIDLTGETHSTSTSIRLENINYLPWATKQAALDDYDEIIIEVDATVASQIKQSENSFIAKIKGIGTKEDESIVEEKIKGSWLIERLQLPANAEINKLWDQPDTTIFSEKEFKTLFPLHIHKTSSQDFNNWTAIDTVYENPFQSTSEMDLILNTQKWAEGFYRITYIATDRYEDSYKNSHYFNLYNESYLPFYNLPIQLYKYDNQAYKGEPGDTIPLKIGSYFDDAHVLLELENYRRVDEYRWFQPKKYKEIPIILKEKHRGNLHFRLISVYNNRFNQINDKIEVPWKNKILNIEYLTFRDNLLPGQDEEWTIKITGPDGKAIAAEILASMYDKALDKLKYHYWNLNAFSSTYSHSLDNWNVHANNKNRYFDVHEFKNWQPTIPNYQETKNPSLLDPKSFLHFNQLWYMHDPKSKDWDKDGVPNNRDLEPFSLPDAKVDAQGRAIVSYELVDIVSNVAGVRSESYADKSYSSGSAAGVMSREEVAMLAEHGNLILQKSPPPPPPAPDENFGDVKVRTDLKETVFFYPHLTTSEDGSVSIKFKMSEALSSWKFMVAAHGKEMQSVVSSKELITQKKLMVMPSTPRFLRQGDEVEISSKIANLSKEDLKGKITLQLFHADSEKPIDIDFNNKKNVLDFELKQGAVNKVEWRIRIPEDWTNPVMYRIIAKAGDFSDGEQNSLPVISNKTLVTEAMPILSHGNSQQDFTFNSLKNNNSKTLQHHQLTLELTPNPAWDAVLSMPYLMEYPYECSEQLFSRFYANSLATQILNSNPKIKTVFEEWAATTSEGSSLDKLLTNPNLKSALLEETPWVMNTQDEAAKRKHIGQLFDLSKMAAEFERVRNKLVERQGEDGGFAWFDGGGSSPFITQYIVGGIGKLNRLGANPLESDDKAQALFEKAEAYMDKAIAASYNSLKISYANNNERKKDKDAIMLDDNLDYNAIQYLYAKSFFWDKENIQKDSSLTLAINFYLKQAALHWRKKSMYHQGMIALALHRMNDESKLAKVIADSIKSKATVDKDHGMYWQQPWGYYWYQLPIETQALMIEVFAEIAKDEQAVYNLKLWLLQKKKGASWSTTKATTTACYALLMTGGDWLSEGKEINVTIGGKKIDQSTISKEAGTGYFQMNWDKKEINSSMATVSLDNPNPTPAFGAVYWQYFEKFDNIKSFKDTPLKIKKELFVQTNSKTGTVNTPIKNAKLKPGDLINVRMELSVGEDMEYIHIKDMRAAGFEPTNVLSGSKYQNGVSYYEMTKDASTNFFFSYLPKGKYIFEYTLRVNHKGDFSNGITTIQCMYAPEFTAHSEGIRVKVE